ncbi:hypothetical protein [Clostridium sp.]|jgi:hypothetical protein|uniref:hypothetical protein n=3 Tax=Clostridium TaxID=1485 RepID=UPI0025BF05C9|nr:hypothetical protein [Clostridium sp.]MCI9304136.1 hypothetical protein [Clostridium sp.]
MKKKQGIVMLEVLMLLNILIFLIVYNAKTIVSNLSKIGLYEIKEDIYYLNDSEYELLNEVENLIKKDEKLLELINSYKDNLKINYEYTFSKNKKMKFIISEGKLYLKELLQGKTESLREIDILVIDTNKENLKVILKPKLYKILYMV